MSLLILCLKVFFVRILDVSLGTLRTLITVREKNLYASLVGFVEILIWFLVVKEALNTDETSIWIAISYAGGFATGTYIGGILSKKFISGNLGVQIITCKADIITNILRERGYAITCMDVTGKDQTKKNMLFLEINKKDFEHLQDLVKNMDPKAFIVVNDTKYVQNGFINNVVK